MQIYFYPHKMSSSQNHPPSRRLTKYKLFLSLAHKHTLSTNKVSPVRNKIYRSLLHTMNHIQGQKVQEPLNPQGFVLQQPIKHFAENAVKVHQKWLHNQSLGKDLMKRIEENILLSFLFLYFHSLLYFIQIERKRDRLVYLLFRSLSCSIFSIARCICSLSFLIFHQLSLSHSCSPTILLTHSHPFSLI